MDLQETATIGEVIGWNIRERRAARWTQPEFGRMIGTLLQKPWPAQTVSSAEKGERAFAAAELVAIAHLLEVPVATLFSPPLPVQRVAVTDKLIIPAQTLHNTGTPLGHHDNPSRLYNEAWSTLGKIDQLRQNIVKQTEMIELEAQSLFIRLREVEDKAEDVRFSRPHSTSSSQVAHDVREAAKALDEALRAEEQRDA